MKSNDEEMQNSDPEDLGQRAAQDAFNSLSLGQSEQMSFEDFKKWFSTLDLSKRTSDTKEKGETLSLQELRMITHDFSYLAHLYSSIFRDARCASERERSASASETF